MADALADLRAMPPGTRRAILRALAPEERKLVHALLATAAAPVTALVETTDGHSPWLAALIEQAAGGDARRGGLTPTVRQHLARSAAPAAPPRTSSRSLLDAVGGLGMGRRRPA